MSTAIVTIGGTGDLSQKKILPALFHLYKVSLLPKNFFILGVSRREKTDEEYREFVKGVLEDKVGADNDYDHFLEKVFYASDDASDPACYPRISERIREISTEPCNILFYLAVPPKLYEPILEGMDGSSLISEGVGGYVRICVEKPFGYDLESAKKLDKKILGVFKEEQIFRIDHYLAKVELENILAFRFSNVLFSPIWNKDHIKRVEIDFWESFGSEERGSFYDEVGALRDVGQNHVLQMLSMIAMENPGKLEAKETSANRQGALEALRVYDDDEIEENTFLAQYEGYSQTNGVKRDTKIETYFKINAFVENERWKGVPFVIEHGKNLPEDKVEARIVFKENLSCLCPDENSEAHQHTNTLAFKIKPERKIEISFWAKKPSIKFDLEKEKLSFLYGERERVPDAYENILNSALSGERLPFISSGEHEAAWKFIDPIVNFWKDREKTLYKKGELPVKEK